MEIVVEGRWGTDGFVVEVFVGREGAVGKAGDVL